MTPLPASDPADGSPSHAGHAGHLQASRCGPRPLTLGPCFPLLPAGRPPAPRLPPPTPLPGPIMSVSGFQAPSCVTGPCGSWCTNVGFKEEESYRDRERGWMEGKCLHPRSPSALGTVLPLQMAEAGGRRDAVGTAKGWRVVSVLPGSWRAPGPALPGPIRSVWGRGEHN